MDHEWNLIGSRQHTHVAGGQRSVMEAEKARLHSNYQLPSNCASPRDAIASPTSSHVSTSAFSTSNVNSKDLVNLDLLPSDVVKMYDPSRALNAQALYLQENPDAKLADLKKRYSDVKRHDQQRNILIEKLLHDREALTEQLRLERKDREREQDVVGAISQREKTLIGNIKHLQFLMDRDPFFLLLIDANCLAINKDFSGKVHGDGAETAARIENEVEQHVQNMRHDLPVYTKLVVRMYGDAAKFGRAFTTSFSRYKDTIDFIDTGSSQNASVDYMLLGNLKLNAHDYHCRQIFLLCSYRENCFGWLRSQESYSQTQDRITIIAGDSQRSYFESLPYLKISLDSVLSIGHRDGDGNLLSQPTGSGSAAGLSEISTRLPRARAASASPDSSKASPLSPHASISHKQSVNAPAPLSVMPASMTTPSLIQRNRKGQRVDPKLVHVKEEVDRVKKLKLCNIHFLRDECLYGNDCTHLHKYSPTVRELQTLRLVARMAPCMNGSYCEDPKCIFGHVCPAPEARNGNLCIFGDDCRFPIELHNIDRDVIKVVKV